MTTAASSPLLRFCLTSVINSELPAQTLSVSAKLDSYASLSQFPDAPQSTKTVIWADFEVETELEQSEAEELASVIRASINEFFHEAQVAMGGSYIDFQAGCTNSDRGLVYRLALFFNVDFHGVLTQDHHWLSSLSSIGATLGFSGTLFSDTAEISSVHSAEALLEVERSLFSPDSTASMPTAVRGLVDSLQSKVPGYVQDKLQALQGQGSESKLPVNLAELNLDVNLDATADLFVEQLRRKISGVPVQVSESVKRKLGGLINLSLRAKDSACIDIHFSIPERVLQSIGAEPGPAAAAPGEAGHDSGADERELWDAVRTGNSGVVTKMLGKGVAPDGFRDGCGCSALFKAAINGRTDIAKHLLTAGANVDLADESSMTPLMAAVLEGHSEVARLLLDHGADCSLRDNNGDLAIDLCDDKALIADLEPGVGEDTDGILHTTMTVEVDAFAEQGAAAAQSVELRALVTDAVDLQEVKTEIVEQAKTVVWLEMKVVSDIDETDAVVFKALLSQVVEAGLASNEDYLSSEVLIQDDVLRITIFLSMDSFELMLAQGPWLKFLSQVKASLEFSEPLAKLIADPQAQLGESTGRINAEIDVYEALLTSEALETVPEGISSLIPPAVVEKLDNEVPPIKHAATSLHVSLNAQQLFQLFEEEVAQGTTAKLLELCSKAPTTVAQIITDLTQGVSCLHYRSAGNAAVDLVFDPAVPLLDLLPGEEQDVQGDGWGADEEDYKLERLASLHPLEDVTSPQFLKRTPSVDRTAEDLRKVFNLLTIDSEGGQEDGAQSEKAES